MRTSNSPDGYQIPPEAAPFMGILLAAHLPNGDVSGFLREEPVEVLQGVASQIRARESLINPFLNASDLPVLDGPSWWMSEVVPAIENLFWRPSRQTEALGHSSGGGEVHSSRIRWSREIEGTVPTAQ